VGAGMKCRHCGAAIRYHPDNAVYLHEAPRWGSSDQRAADYDNRYFCTKDALTCAEPAEMGVVEPQRRPGKTYLGYGIYGTFESILSTSDALVLTMENGIAVTDRIVLEPQVLAGLLRWIRASIGDEAWTQALL